MKPLSAINDWLKKKISYAKKRVSIDYHASSEELSKEIDSRIAERITVIVISFLFILIIWACFVTIQETAVTQGQIIPENNIPVLEHLEGGVVTKLLVKEGQHVKAGQNLIALNSVSILANLTQLQTRLAALQLETKRLDELTNVKHDAKILNSLLERSGLNVGLLQATQTKLLASQIKFHANQVSIIKSQVQQKQEELNEITHQIKVEKRNISILARQLKIYKYSTERKVISKVQYLNVSRQYNKAQGDLSQLQSRKAAAIQLHSEYKSKLLELDSSFQKQLLEERKNIEAQISELRAGIQKYHDQYLRSKIQAPQSGFIKGLDVTVGSVIKPGETILELIPDDETMVAEIKITSKDIGHIQVGNKARIRITTFDYARYGAIDGVVIEISHAAFQDEDKKPYYKAKIRLSKQAFMYRGQRYKLLPGMTLEADINTGEKTFISYLLKPINALGHKAFSER